MGKVEQIVNWKFALQRGNEELEYKDVTVPHDWAVNSPINKEMQQGAPQGFRDRWGKGFYKTTIEVDKEENKVYYLNFDGVYEMSSVYINDTYVGGRRYGYSPFKIDITDNLKKGTNEIFVKVDNTNFPADRWYSGAGIYRKVYLETVPKNHICLEDVIIKTVFKDESELLDGVDLTIENGLFENGLNTLTLNKGQYKLWSAEEPNLITLKIKLLEDEKEINYGIRKEKLDPDKGLFINNESVKLKGVCLHQEAGVFGTAVPKDIYRKRLEELKEIGCNALRLAHHLYAPEVLDLCDEMGFYVYEEAFDKWTGGAYGRHYATEWEKDLEAMVKRDRNRPSIIFWGVGNEVENQAYPKMLTLLENHVKKVKSMDSTRPVSLAMNPHFVWPELDKETDMSEIKDIQKYVDEKRSGEIEDIDDRIGQIKLIAEKVDVLACNYQEQWYKRMHELIPDRAIIGTETYMFFRGEKDKMQNFSEKNPWLDVLENDFVVGGFIWTGIDYLGESMGLPALGWSGALFSTDLEKREIAWVYQSYWNKKADAFVRFAVMDYTIPDKGTKEAWEYPHYVAHWEFPMFNKCVIPYMIATNCDKVLLKVADKEFYAPKKGDNGYITGYIPYLKGKVTVIGLSGDGKELCRQEIVTPSIAVKLKFDECKDMDKDYFQVKVRAVDENENPVFRESARVKFVVEGDGLLVGVDTGDITSHEPYDEDTHHLYHGHASAFIKRTGKGRIKISAYGDGLFGTDISN